AGREALGRVFEDTAFDRRRLIPANGVDVGRLVTRRGGGSRRGGFRPVVTARGDEHWGGLAGPPDAAQIADGGPFCQPEGVRDALAEGGGQAGRRGILTEHGGDGGVARQRAAWGVRRVVRCQVSFHRCGERALVVDIIVLKVRQDVQQ